MAVLVLQNFTADGVEGKRGDLLPASLLARMSAPVRAKLAQDRLISEEFDLEDGGTRVDLPHSPKPDPVMAAKAPAVKKRKK